MLPVRGVRPGRIPRRLALALLLAGALATPASAALRAAKPASAAARARRPAEPAVVVPVPVAAPSPASPPPAIVAELRAHPGKLKDYYASRGFRPLWARDGTIGPEADALVAFLASAEIDGLKPSAYKPRSLQRAIASARKGKPANVIRAEVKLSQALARYAADLRALARREQSGAIYADAALQPPAAPPPDQALRAANFVGDFRTYVTAMQWMSPHYLRMRGLLAEAEAQNAPEDVQRRIRLNLARARVLPGPLTMHIVVDAGSGQLWYYQAGREQGTMRVVVGKQASPTPMLVGTLHYAVVNPYWNVPTDLAQTLIAPKVLSGRTLKSMNMEALSDWTETARPLNPARIDWHEVAAGTRELRVRQLPGPYNSMGKVKFLFPNDFGIFLHDTPERELLAENDRHFSNGCIRLEDADRLGRWLLGKPLRALPHRPEQTVQLPVPVPVYLTYFTADEGPDGAIALRNDVYGRDNPPLALGK